MKTTDSAEMSDPEGSPYHEPYNKNRRASMWSSARLAHNLESMLERGRRGSAAQVITRICNGAFPTYANEPGQRSDATTSFLQNIKEGVAASNDDMQVDPKVTRQQGNENLGQILSALYGKLLVVMGIAFPMSEVISTYIPPSYYDGFYIYLYGVSIIYMLSLLTNSMKSKATRSARELMQRMRILKRRTGSADSGLSSRADPEDGSNSTKVEIGPEDDMYPVSEPKQSSILRSRETDSKDNSTDALNESSGRHLRFGSFYLRMGAVAFGIGSMIYSGLEFGQYLELAHDTHCQNFMTTVTPLVRIIFTFMQMYFIFLHYKEAVARVSMIYQFGLMHMIGTNLCVWLNVLVLETRHEILHFYDPNNKTISLQKYLNKGHEVPLFSTGYHKGHVDANAALFSNTSNVIESITTTLVSGLLSSGNDDSLEEFDHAVDVHRRMKRGLRGPHSIYECRRTNIMGNVVTDASPFLFPCTIEYSLTCAAICYVMWKSIANRRAARHGGSRKHGEAGEVGLNRSPHHYTVDCARANKGLFLGIFALVLTIMCLIVNFVLADRPGYQNLATLQLDITGIVIYTMTTLAVLIGMCQVRGLRYDSKRNLELDNILLIVAQTGSFIHNMFSIIAGQFTVTYSDKLSQMTALTCLIQTMLQTLFILDASKRSASNAMQAKMKPGREVVTFLLVTNLGMWLIHSLEKSRDIVQIHFYGIWAWTIITDISMPLAIFYRFHSTVCLCEVWKKIGKLRC